MEVDEPDAPEEGSVGRIATLALFAVSTAMMDAPGFLGPVVGPLLKGILVGFGIVLLVRSVSRALERRRRSHVPRA